MKYTYTHNNQYFSVVVLRDGRVMEIRRGARTFYLHDSARQRWDSVEAWRATWPDGAIEMPQKPVHPLLKRIPGNSTCLPTIPPGANQIINVQNRVKILEKRVADNKRNNTKCWGEDYELKNCQKMIDNYAKYRKGEYKYPPKLKTTRNYVVHNGQIMGVYHNKTANLVVICQPGEDYDEPCCYTPEELGITADATLFTRRWDGMMLPIAKAD